VSTYIVSFYGVLIGDSISIKSYRGRKSVMFLEKMIGNLKGL